MQQIGSSFGEWDGGVDLANLTEPRSYVNTVLRYNDKIYCINKGLIYVCDKEPHDWHVTSDIPEAIVIVGNCQLELRRGL